MDSSESIGVYGEAKAEYTRQLCNFLVPALETYFLDLLTATKESEKDPKRILWSFQDALKQFPDWNMDKVTRETQRISDATHCDYLEEILTAVFIAHTKVLSAIRLTSRQKKLQITIPKLNHFLHRTMSECARLLWSNAYLFNDNSPAIERQKNLRQVSQLLNEGVLQSIRGMLPVKSILKEYLNEEAEDTPAAEAEEAAEEAQPEMAVEPVIKEEEKTPILTAVDISGAVLEEKKETVDVEEKETVDVEEEEKEKEKEDVVEEEEKTEEKAEEKEPPMIQVDTEPSVSFTGMDTVFHYNAENNEIGPSSTVEAYPDEIVIDESSAPEPLDEYESLEKDDDRLSFAEDEVETL
jgi:hypothetical protein